MLIFGVRFDIIGFCEIDPEYFSMTQLSLLIVSQYGYRWLQCSVIGAGVFRNVKAAEVLSLQSCSLPTLPETNSKST